MKKEYRVQCLYQYRNGTGQWYDWGSTGVVETLGEAIHEKRRGESLYPDHKFRVVSREVTEWVECKEVAK